MELYSFDPKKDKFTPSDSGDLSGARRAALLLVALGKESAAEVIKHLDEPLLETISQEIGKIGHLSLKEQERILNTFFDELKKGKFRPESGTAFAKDLLDRAFGEKKANEILDRYNKIDSRQYFKNIENTDPEILTKFLAEEHPQIICIILANLKPKVAAEILQNLPDEIRPQVTLRLAKMEKTSPQDVNRIALLFDKKIREYLSDNNFQKIDGFERAVNILNQVDSFTERHILEEMETDNPLLAEKIKDKLVTFELLKGLSNHEMRLLLDRLDSDTIIVFALKGASDDLKRHFLSNVSRNRARDILNSWDNPGKVTTKQIQEARDEILHAAKVLDKKGQVVLRKYKEKWVD